MTRVEASANAAASWLPSISSSGSTIGTSPAAWAGNGCEMLSAQGKMDTRGSATASLSCSLCAAPLLSPAGRSGRLAHLTLRPLLAA
jgi:hypothetical protein